MKKIIVLLLLFIVTGCGSEIKDLDINKTDVIKMIKMFVQQ